MENEIIQWLPGITVTPQYVRSNTPQEDYSNYFEDIKKDQEQKDIQRFTNNIRQSRGNFAMNYVLPSYLALSNPVAFVASSIGGNAVDNISKSAGYNDFGDMISKVTNSEHPTLYSLLNPGYLLGGAGLSNNSRRVITSRASGVKDALKYGIQDRVNALRTYKNLPNNIERNLIPVSDKGIIQQGLSVVDDRLLANGKINMGWNDKVQLIGNMPYTNDIRLGALLGPGSVRAALTPRAKNAKEISKGLQLAFAKGLKNIPSGSTLSGNAPAPTLGQQLGAYGIYDVIPEGLHKFVKPFIFLKGGLSSKGGNITEDAYKSILKLGNTKGHTLHYTPGKAGEFKGNSYLANLQQKVKQGKLDVESFIEEFNKQISQYKGRPAHVNLMREPVIYHPAVYFN